MQITSTPAPNSTVVLEIELPPDRLDKALSESVRHLSRRTRVPGFRPGKAPRSVLERSLAPGAVLDDAVEHLTQDAYRDALVQEDIIPLTNADVEIVQAEEGKPFIFKATVQVRPEVTLGDYRNFNFGPEIEPTDDARVAMTTLRMDRLTQQQLDGYLAGGQWKGKAGAFGYQDRLGWVHIVNGSASNVVGLPMELLAEMLSQYRL